MFAEFDIVKELLHSPRTKLSLDAQTIEDICLTSSREFYDNASSGNFKFGDMKLAYDWHVFSFLLIVRSTHRYLIVWMSLVYRNEYS